MEAFKTMNTRWRWLCNPLNSFMLVGNDSIVMNVIRWLSCDQIWKHMNKYVARKIERVIFHLSFILFCLLTCSFVISFLKSSQLAVIGNQFTEKLNNSIRIIEIKTSKHYYTRKPHPLTNGMTYPFILEKQARFVGEDARFICSGKIIGFNTSTPHINQVLWYKDNKLVKPTHRHNITWQFEELDNTAGAIRVFRIISTLEILLIDEEDFGNYSCHISQRTNFEIPPMNGTRDDTGDDDSPQINKEKAVLKTPYKCSCNQEFTPPPVNTNSLRELQEELFHLWNNYRWAAEFRLIKEKERKLTLFIAPGDFVSVLGYFRHLDDPSNNRMFYTVKGKEYNNTQPRCSVFVLLHHILINRGEIDSKVSVAALYKLLTAELNKTKSDYQYAWSATISIISHCMEPDLYGEHEIMVERTIHNATDNTTFVKYFKHPMTLDIKPKEPDLFDYFGYEYPYKILNFTCWSSHDAAPSSTCWVILKFVQKLYDGFHNSENLLIISIFCISSVIMFIMYRFYKICIVYLRRFCPLEHVLAISDFDGDQSYHACLLYSEEDRTFVQEKVLSITKKISMVCFDPHDDIPLGAPINISLGDGISHSVLCIVIASEEYTKNVAKNEFEMNIILYKAKAKELLIINKDNCNISGLFKEIYPIINFSTQSNHRQFQRLFLDWVYSNLPTQQLFRIEVMIVYLVIAPAYLVKYYFN